MKGIKVYSAKRAVFARLEFAKQQMGAFPTVDIDYAAGGDGLARCIYGGGVRFEQEDAVAEPGVLVREDDAISLYIRVMSGNPIPAGGIKDTDALVEAIVEDIDAVLRQVTLPEGDGFKYVRIMGGQGDYFATDTEVGSIMAIQVKMQSMF